jgi:hypothetical protein
MNKPKMPLTKVINESRQVSICRNCGSSMVRKKWWYLFGEVFCINEQCKIN